MQRSKLYAGKRGMLMRTGNAYAPVSMTWWLATGRRLLLAALLVAASGCAASPSSQADRGAPTTAVTPARSGPKAIAIAFPIDPTALSGGMLGLGAATVPSRFFKEFPNAYLTTYNAQDEPVPWLAT